MTLFRPLAEITRKDLAEYGGKAANLGEAIHLGCPVPEGVVLSTELYRRFMVQGGLQGEISSILATMQPTAMAHFQATEWAIQEAFKVRRMPDEVTKAIREAWRALGVPVAVVRSSAMSGSVQHSFVGQYATQLQVMGEESFIKATVNCWMSLFSAKALSYAYHFGIDLANSAMAVLLQRMLAPTARGALFTVDPITGNSDVFVLEIRQGAQAGVHRLDPYDRQPGEPGYWTHLREIGLLLDEHAAAYQTIEWALVEDSPFLLRVRAATKVPTYLPIAAGEMGTGLGRGPLELVQSPLVSSRALRPYSWYHRSRSQSLSSAYFSRALSLFVSYTGRDDFYLCGYLYTRWQRANLPAFDEEIDPLRRLVHSLARLYAARSLEPDFRLLWREKRPRLDNLVQTDLKTLSNPALGDHLHEVMGLDEAFTAQCGRLGESHKALADILMRLHRRWLGDTNDCSALLYTEDQKSRRDEALLGVARAKYADDSAREAAFSAFLRRYRHLYLQGQPLTDGQDLLSWRVDDAAARAVWRSQMQSSSGGAQGLRAEGRAWRAAEQESAEQRVLAKLNRTQRLIYHYVLNLARRYAPLRVDRDEPVLLTRLLEGEAVREAGQRLQAEGIARVAEDAGLLNSREILDWLAGTVRREVPMRAIMERRDLYRRCCRYNPPDVLG
jgi:hypothetical protein